jgi:predicted DCC family thiol-disulfide oxidoreductase YuxK
VNTEITETVCGYVFYDATCPICRKWVGRIHGALARRGFHPVRLQALWAGQRLGIAEGESLVEMKLLTRDGKIYGGVDALVRIAGTIWWLWPLFLLAQVPGMKILLKKTYIHLAANRACDDGKCALSGTVSRKHHGASSSFFEMP